MKENLIELVKEARKVANRYAVADMNETIAEQLLAARIVPPCNVGSVLYSIVDCVNRPEKIYVTAVHMYEKYNSITALSRSQREYVFKDNDFGEVVFYTEKEALEALNKRRNLND